MQRFARLLNGDFNTAEWIRLQASVNGGQILPIRGISEVSIVTLDPNDMNRYELKSPDGAEVHKGSGLLIATAYGMRKHAWAKNESQYLLNRLEHQ